MPSVAAHDWGVTISAEGTALDVDASSHALIVEAPASGVWELGASRAGVGQVLVLARDELAVGRLDSDDSRAVIDGVVGALRRAAESAGVCAHDVERGVSEIRATPLVHAAGFLDAPYLRKDAERFRACRVAIACVEEDHDDDGTPEHADAVVERLARWRDLFAHGGKATRAVNATLARFGETAAADALWGLRNVPLTRPAASAEHVAVLGALGAHPRAPRLLAHMALVEAAPAGTLADAAALAVESFGLPPNIDPCHALAEMLASVPNARDVRSFSALINLAVDWWSASYPDETETVLPPIPLPDLPGFTFLKTFGEIIAEGRAMRHCVASRRLEALAGKAFLFHVDVADGEATVQVDEHGHVVEARGPKNVDSAAVRYARTVLGAWGRAFWAARFDIDAPTARLPPALLPSSSEPLLTVRECIDAYRRGCEVMSDDDGELERWWTENVDRAVRGEVALVLLHQNDRTLYSRTGVRWPTVVAVDSSGGFAGSTGEVLELMCEAMASPRTTQITCSPVRTADR